MMNTIAISFTGDFVLNDETLSLVQEESMYEFAPEIKAVFKESDLVITNLETPLTLNNNPILKTGYNFAAHPDNAKLIKNLGVGVACLANNHILDQNEQGVLDTIEACNRNGIKTVGAGRNLKEAQKPLILDVKGKKIGIINFCEHEFSIAETNRAGANPFDIIDNYRQLTALREEVDVVIVVFHGSLEYHHLPMPHYKKACEFFVDAGADAVVGHHPHYCGGYSYYNGKPIFYSLGNFFARSRRKDEELNRSYIVKMEISDSIIFDLIPLQINKQLPYIVVKDDDVCLAQVNSIIQDEEKLVDYWNKVAVESVITTKARLFSISKTMYRLLKRLKIMQRFTSRFHSLVLRNIVYCESHHELLKKVLFNMTENVNNGKKK